MQTFPVVRTAASAVLPPSTDGANKRGERSNAATVGTCKVDRIQSRRRLRKAADTQAERQRVVEGSQIVKIQKNSRHPIPQAEQLFKPKSRNVGVEGDAPRLSLGVSKGVFSSEREYPLCLPFPCAAQENPTALQHRDLCIPCGCTRFPIRPAELRDKFLLGKDRYSQLLCFFRLRRV